MRRIKFSKIYVAWAFLLLIMIFLMSCSKRKVTFYLSPSGNDAWSGQLESSNNDLTDGPFATFDRLQKAILSVSRSKLITVYLRGGDYLFKKPFRLISKDSTRNYPQIVIQAYPGESVRLIGARKICQLRSVRDPAVLKRFQKAVRSKILQVNLKAQGISDLGEITRRGPPPLDVFYQQKRMPIARYPNKGWLRIADVPQTGKILFRKGLEREKRYDGVPVGRHYGRITYSGSRPNRWSDDNEIYMHGYWTWDWSDSYQRVQSIDRRKKEITIARPHHHYGYTKNQRYYFLNILEELDQPGEWCLSRKKGILYFYPPDTAKTPCIWVSNFRSPFFVLKNIQNILIKNINFEFSAGGGILVSGGRKNVISGCSFSNIGDNAVVINGASESGVRNCEISDTGMGGILLRGGNRKTLFPGKDFAVNNHIHHYSQWIRTGQYAISLYGVGNRISHNLIHDAPHEGIHLSGNDHLIEYNEIHDVCQETGDAGAIHTGRDYTWRGNVIRYNYFHHLKGPGLHGVTATYLDDFASGFKVYGNIYYKTTRGVLIGGGRDNVVENNIFVDCHPSIVLDARGLGWASNYFDGTITTLFDRLKQVNAFEPPYIKKYPNLKALKEGNPAVPANNKILHNISCGGLWMDLFDFYAYDFSKEETIQENIIADPVICKRLKKRPKGWDPYYLNIDFKNDYEFCTRNDPEVGKIFKGNLILSDNYPIFKELKHGRFALDKNSIASKNGFRYIPLKKIGLIKNKRKSDF